MPNLKPYLWSLRFWLVLCAAAFFTIGAIRASAATPAIAISAPQPNETVTGNQIDVMLTVTDFQLVEFQNNALNRNSQGHINLWLDQAQPNKATAIKTASPSYSFTNVKPGAHTLTAELVNNDHSSLTPAVITSVNFTSQLLSQSVNPSAVLWMSIIAFLLVCSALFMVSSKTKLSSHKPPKKSAQKSAKKH